MSASNVVSVKKPLRVSSKEPLKSSKKYKHYSAVRNFAEHKCHKVRHHYDEANLEFFVENGYPSIVSQVDEMCKGKYTFTRTHFYFEDEEDAVFATLLFKDKD